MELIKRRLANLLAVKSLVTVILTVVFAYLAVTGHVSTEQFLDGVHRGDRILLRNPGGKIQHWDRCRLRRYTEVTSGRCA